MYKGKNRTAAIQLYKSQLEVTPAEGVVLDHTYTPSRHQERISASQIIHTQNVHHHHHYGNQQAVDPDPAQKQVDLSETSKPTNEELFVWFGSILGCTFTFGFLFALLLRG